MKTNLTGIRSRKDRHNHKGRLLLWALLCLAIPFDAAHAADKASLRDQMRAREYPPIFEYVWRKEVNDELTEDRLEDWRRMGFTGFQKTHTTLGGRHFTDGEIVTLTGHVNANPQYLLDDNGKEVSVRTIYGDLAHPDTPGLQADWLVEKIRKEGDNLFKIGDTQVVLTGDEYDRPYGVGEARVGFFRYAGENHLAAWRDFLRQEYGDTPETRSKRSGRSYNEDAATAVNDWSEVPRPEFTERFEQPRLWDVYRRFLVELNHGFFDKVKHEAAERGQNIAMGINSHGSVFYPGGPPSAIGGDPFIQGRRGDLLVNEAVSQDWPTSAIAYAFFNRYSREYDKPVLAYSWFWPGSRNGVSQQFMEGNAVVDRFFARTLPNDVHGLLYWTYANNTRNFPEVERIAFWHQWYREHWPMLRDSRPVSAQAALFFPNRTADFYLPYKYPKKEFSFSAQALIDLQVPFTCIGEYELEQGKGLDGVKLLIVAGAERVSAEAAKVIEKFLADGGVVLSTCDSLAVDIAGAPLGLLEKHFAVKPAHKYKRRGEESALSLAEEAWTKGEAGATLPDRTPYGAAQSPFDIENPQWIDLEGKQWSLPRLRTVNEFVTADALHGGKVLGTYRGKPVIVETDHTLWMGTRAGADLAAATSRDFMNEMAEPIPEDWPRLAESIGGRAPYTEIFERAVDKAGIRRVAGVFHPEGRRAHRIETGVRELDGGGLLVILSDRDIKNPSDKVALPYVLRVDADNAAYSAWDLLEGRMLKRDGKDGYLVEVPVHRAAYIVIAPEKTITAAAKRQARVNAMDHAPKPWRHGPRGGPKEPPVPVITRSGETKGGTLGEGVLAEVRVSVANTTQTDKPLEPIVLTGGALADLYPGLPVGGVTSEDASVQWFDAKGDGILSREDVIAWQADLPAGKTKYFTLRFHAKRGEPALASAGDFTSEADKTGTRVRLGKRTLFQTNEHGEWNFANTALADGTKVALPPMTGFILHMTDQAWMHPATDMVSLRAAKIVADGPVFKTLRLTFADDEDKFGTVADYTVYAGQPDDEIRIYADVVHRVDKRVDLWSYPRPALFHNQRMMIAGVLTLEQSRQHPRKSRSDTTSWYADGLERLSDAEALEANNFGGWTATKWDKGGLAQVSFRRVRGTRELVGLYPKNVLPYEAPGIEADGFQVLEDQVVRAAFDLHPPDPTAAVDMMIPEGTRWKIDALISLRPKFDEAGCRAARAAFASPPKITIDSVVVNRQP